MKCILCHKQNAQNFYSSQQGKSVSSDCRALDYGIEIYICNNCFHIQKEATESYLKTVEYLYQSYETFILNNGEEQLSFSSEIPYSRSSQIIKNSHQYCVSVNNALDIGCGSGVYLKALNQYYPKMSLSGYDVSVHNKKDIEVIQGVKYFYSGDLKDINEKYDLIILSHVLEHVSSPVDFLNVIKGLLSEHGRLIIQVPNVVENPIDLFVYDHVSHFSIDVLSKFLSNLFDYVYLPEDQIFKEITYVVSNSPVKNKQCYKVKCNTNIHQYIQTPFYMMKNMENFVGLINSPTYVFSTGPAGTLLGHLLGDKLIGFIDEDECRVGKLHLNKKVYDITYGESLIGSILLPFNTEQNKNIKKRLNSLNFIN